MPDHNPVKELQRRLVERGCPAKVVRKIVRETAEHYEDLQRAAQAQGLAGDQAIAYAAEKLGKPNELAERHLEALRKSSWWGRCPQFAFGVLPLLVMLELGLQYYSLNRGGMPINLDRKPIPYPQLVEWAYPAFYLAAIVVTATVTFFFARQALRYGVARRWLWITAGLLAIHGVFLQIHASSGIGLSLNQPLILANQKVAPGHPMEIDGISLMSDRVALFHSEQEYSSDYRYEVRPVGLKGDKYWKLYESPDLEEKISQGVAELSQRSLRGQLPSHTLHDPGWTTTWSFGAVWQRAWTNRAGRLNSGFQVDRDDAGNLLWTMWTGDMVPWPVVSYGLPGLGYGDVFQAINIASPLLIVAAMLAWRRRKGKQLLRESSLIGVKLTDVA